MPDDKRDYQRELDGVVVGLAESTLYASDDEIRDEFRDEAYPPGRVAAEIRETVLVALAELGR